MFILLVIILTFISISLKLLGSSIELAEKVYTRSLKKKEKEGKYKDDIAVDKVVRSIPKVGMKISSKALKLASKITWLAKDFMAFIGSFIIVYDIIVLIVIVVSSSMLIYSNVDTNTQVENTVEVESVENN